MDFISTLIKRINSISQLITTAISIALILALTVLKYVLRQLMALTATTVHGLGQLSWYFKDDWIEYFLSKSLTLNLDVLCYEIHYFPEDYQTIDM